MIKRFTTLVLLTIALFVGIPGDLFVYAAHTTNCTGVVHYGHHSSVDYYGVVFFHRGYHTRYYGGTCGFGNDVHIGSHKHSQ